MNSRAPSVFAGGVPSRHGVGHGPLRAALLASTTLALATMLPVGRPALAQDATWLANPGSGDFHDANNWTPGLVPTGTATFGTSNATALTLGTPGSFGGWTFEPGASDYTFDLTSAQVFNGEGIAINGGSVVITNNDDLRFVNTSTAGSAALINNAGGVVDFSDSTGPNGDGRLSAGSIAGAGSYVLGTNQLTIGSNNLSTEVSGIISGAGGSLVKTGTGTTILTGANTYSGGTTVADGKLQIGDGGATGSILGAVSVVNWATLDLVNADMSGITTISNDGLIYLSNGTGAGNASIANGGNMYFVDTSTAGHATIANDGGLLFYQASSADHATITNDSDLLFLDTSTAGHAAITNNRSMFFFGASTADSATISSANMLYFYDTSTAGSASIANTGSLSFRGASTAGNATITNNSVLEFRDTSTAGNAALINNAGGVVDFSRSTGPNGDGRLSAGSIAGASTYALGANQLTVGSNDLSTEVSGLITGAGGSLVKTGTGTLTLSGANTYGGGTTIAGGTLQLGNGGATGSIAGNVVNDGVLAFNRSDLVTFAGSISGTGAVQQLGSGTTILSGTSTYSGGTTVADGTLQLGNGGATGSISGDVVNNGTLAFNRSDLVTFAGGISGTGAVQQLGSGTTILTGTNTYSGGTTVDGGTLKAGAAAGFVNNTAYAVNGGTLDLGGFDLTMSSLSGEGGTVALGAAVLTIDQAANSTFAGAMTATGGALVKTGTGTLTLSGTNTYGGGATINNGTLQLGTIDSAGAIVGTVTLGASGTFDVVNADTSGITSMANGGVTNFRNGTSAGHAGITNNGGLIFHDTGTAGSATIANNNYLSFNDSSTAGNAALTSNREVYFYNNSAAGSATIANNGDLGFYDTSSAGSATITNNGGLGFGDTSTAGSATITNGGNLAFGRASTAGTATITNNKRLFFYESSTADNAAITNNAEVVFGWSSTAGSATIANNNGGKLYFHNNSTAGNAAITNNGGGTVDFSISTGPNNDRKLSAGSIAGAGNYILGANELTVGGNNRSTEVSGVISGAGGSLVKTGTGTLTLTGANTYTGGTTIAGGTLEIGNGGATGSISGDVVNNGILAFNRSDAATFEGSISGTGAVQQIGMGTLTLTGASTYGGGTVISGGTLQIGDGGAAGAILGTVTVGSGTTFDVVNADTSGITTISNDGFTYFSNDTSAGSAAITNNSLLKFSDTSTAGSAVITNNSGLLFSDSSTAGNAALNNAGGVVDFSNSTGPNGDGRLSAGSIAGAGNYVLGTNELTIGSNNLSTEVSGIISGAGGSLVKTGTGTTILTGANTYSGGTTVAGGRLQFGDGVSGGDNNLGGSIDVTGGTLAIQTPATLNVAQTVTFGNNTALSIAAGAHSPALSADSVTIGNGVALNISGIADASQLDMVLLDTASGISGDFDHIGVGGFGGTVDYLTVSTRKSEDSLRYLASYGLAWTAGNTLAHGTFTLTDAADSFTVGTVLADQAANPATGWSGTALTKAGAGTLILTAANTYSGGTTISGGTLSVSSDANMGRATGGLTFAGGTLSTTASFDTTRTASLTQEGRIDVAAGTELGLTGVVSGSGDLIKQGSGTLRLDNSANAYGDTLVLAGTVIGNAGSISGHIGNAGTVVFDQAGNASFAGDVAALDNTSGAMIKRGSGVLTLTGLSSLDWAVEAGGLVSSAERFGVDAAIASGASFTFDQSANATYAGVLSGSGGFGKTGTALLNLTGDSSGFIGTTDVTAGALAVNGQLGGTMSVRTGGRLQGTGTVDNVIVSGMIAPGNSIGTLNVGTVTFNAGSVYEVEVNAAGQSDRIAASSVATIDGGTVQVLAGAGKYAPQTQYTVLTAMGGLTGTFTGLTSNLAFLDPTLTYDTNNVYLTMTRNNIDFAGVGITPNQIATGGGVQSLGFGNPVYDAVLDLSEPQAQYAFDQLSGEIHASARTALIEDSRFVGNAVNDRLRAAFDGVGASGTATAYVDGKPVTVSADTDRPAVWGQGFGSWGHSDSDGNAATLDRKTGGLFMGADAPVFDTWRLGVVAGHSRTDFDAKSRHSSGSSDSSHLGLYGGTAWDDLAFRTGAAYTWHDISTNRTVSFAGFDHGLQGNYNAATAQVFGELAYGFSMGGTRFEPFANLAYVNLQTDDFTEKGGVAALTSLSSSTDTTFTTLGLRASSTFDLGGMSATAKGMLGWRHAFGDTIPGSVMSLAGGAPFSIAGLPIASNAAVVDLGLDMNLSAGSTLGVSYGGQFGSGATDQTFRATFNAKF